MPLESNDPQLVAWEPSAPANPFDLIGWSPGAPRFNDPDDGLDGWWDHYQQGKLFYLVCAQERAKRVGYDDKAELFPYIETALHSIAEMPNDNWRFILDDASQWKKCHSSQMTDAVKRRPLLLIKALVVLVAFEKFIKSRGADIGNYYRHVFIVPANYIVNHNGKPFMPGNRDIVERALFDAGHPAPNTVLTDHHGGQGVCFKAANIIRTVSGNDMLTIDFAQRAGFEGNMKPAASGLRYPCPRDV